jgi:MmyB-like transcription regulator ligand binding domain
VYWQTTPSATCASYGGRVDNQAEVRQFLRTRRASLKPLTDLIGELVTRSDEFRYRWSARDVRFHRSGTKRIRHPDVGDLEFAYEGLELPDSPGLLLYAYTTIAGSPAEERLQLLGNLAATDAAPSTSHA